MRRVVLAAVLAAGLAAPAAADYWSRFEAAVAAYAAGDFVRAQRGFAGLAEGGDPHAQYWLGVMYFEGKGVPQDDVRAYVWFTRAAAKGNRGGRVGRAGVTARMSAAEIAEAERRLGQPRRID